MAGALQGWLTDHDAPVQEGSDVAGQKREPPAPLQPDPYFRRLSVHRASQKRARAAAVEPDVPEGVHVPEGYTDAPYALEAPRQGFAANGVWFRPMDPQNMAQPLEGVVQTVNRAELSACIEAPSVAPHCRWSLTVNMCMMACSWGLLGWQ